MNTIDQLKLDSYQEVDQVLVINASVYEVDEATKAQVVLFTGYKTDLFALGEKMDEPTEWLTIKKKDIKNQLNEKLFPLSNNLICFANSKSDNLIIEKVKISRSVLANLSEVNLIAYAQDLIKIAQDNIAQLVEFSITEETVASVQTDLTAFQTNRTQRLMLLDDKNVARSDFYRLKKKTNQFLKNELDHSIEKYRQSNPDFVNHYFTARQTAKGIQHPYELLGYLSDKSNGQVIGEGEVSAEGLGLKASISPTGSFRFKSFPTGDHRLKIVSIGYKTLYVPIRRFETKSCKLYIEMEAMPLLESNLV